MTGVTTGAAAVGAGDGALRDFELRVGVLREAGGTGLLVFCRVLLVEPGAERSCMALLTPTVTGALVGLLSDASFLALLRVGDDLWALPLTESTGVLWAYALVRVSWSGWALTSIVTTAESVVDSH